MHVVVTHSVIETESLGARLAALLHPGDFIVLSGELGSGKTCFARGVAAGLGVAPTVYVTSPTYTLMNPYEGRIPLYHFDLYRLDGDEAGELGFEEYFYGDGVCLIEWAERLAGLLPSERLEITFYHEADDKRRLEFIPFGRRFDQVLRLLFP